MKHTGEIRGTVNYFGNLGLFMLSWGVAIYWMSRKGGKEETTCKNLPGTQEVFDGLWTSLQFTVIQISNRADCFVYDTTDAEPVASVSALMFALVAAYSLRVYVNIIAFAVIEQPSNGARKSASHERVYVLLSILHLIMIGLLMVTIENLPVICVIGIQFSHSGLHVLYWMCRYYDHAPEEGGGNGVRAIIWKDGNRWALVVDGLFFMIPVCILLIFPWRSENWIGFETAMIATFHGVIIIFLCIVSEIILTFRQIYREDA